MTRPRLRDVFLRLERQPIVHFYTTSADKFAQAQQAFQQAGLSVTEFRSRDDPYREDEEGTSIELLRAALDEICRSVDPAASSLFFVEDTSLRLEALSAPTRDFPGLRVKQWFAQTSFNELDAELRRRGNNRCAVVKSDIALHVPHLERPVYFHGETSGVVADAPPAFEADPSHPWLNPYSFSGWFIPNGALKPLGAMSLDESWRYDFRGKALQQLLDRLEEYTAALNLPTHAAPRRTLRVGRDRVMRLFGADAPKLVVVGPTCAGKTTFGLQAATPPSGADREVVRHVEASDVVRTFNGGPHEGEPAVAFAQRILGAFGPDVVARRIVDEYFGDSLEEGFVITGFRTVQELLYLREQFEALRVLYVDAPLRVRYDRFRARARSDDPLSLEEFRQRDHDQAHFGLLSVGPQLADLYLRNDQNMKTYRKQIEAILAGMGRREIPGLSVATSKQRAEQNQLLRCLEAMAASGRPLATDEIEAATGIRHNNANKILKRYPALARRLETGTGRLRYAITDAGRAFVTYMQRYVGSARSRPAEVDDEGAACTSASRLAKSQEAATKA